MSNKHQYFRGTTEISEADALDHNNIIKDGITVRVRTQMRDSEMTDTRALFHDGTPSGGGNRPGWRIRLHGDTINAGSLTDAYAAYETRLTNAYRLKDDQVCCPQCDGSGFAQNGNECTRCLGKGYLGNDDAIQQQDAGTIRQVPSFDTRSLDEIMRSHRERMTQLYDQHDRELSEAWRQR